MGLVGGGEVAETRFGSGDEGFETGDLLFGVVKAVFERLELDGVEALGGGCGFGGRRSRFARCPHIRVDVWGTLIFLCSRIDELLGDWCQGVCDLFGYFFGAALFAPEIVFVVAGVDVDALVFDLEDTGGEAVDEVAVVGDEEDGASEVADGVEEDVFGAEVEVVGGLVEEEHVAGGDEHLGHGVAVALAAGEDAEFFEDVVA